MAEHVCRREPFVRLIKLMSLIVSLMFLINTVSSLDFGNNLDMYKESIQAMVEQAVGFKKHRQNRIESITRLLKEAQSLTNEEELETFMENLQEAVDEAYEQKIEDKYRIAAAAQQFNLKLLELYPKLQNFKMMSAYEPEDDQLIRVSEKIIESGRTYITLKKKVISPEAEDIGQSLKEVLNILKKSQQEHHDEL